MKPSRLRLLFCLGLGLFRATGLAEPVELQAGPTLRAVELNRGESFSFRLANGASRTFELLDTEVQVLLTNLVELKKPQDDGGTIYLMRCRLRVNGQALTLERYVGSQESFYVPVVVDGVRLWFDGVRAAGSIISFGHGPCLPAKDARFAVQDATLRICPDEVLPWFHSDRLSLDIANCYAGGDCWMGAYKGAEAHGGLDINQPKASPVLAPIALEDHYLFHQLEDGANNNRWRGGRSWPDGSRWTLQVHHLLSLLVPEHTPIEAGAIYALGGGVLPGTHLHVHYNFKITPAGARQPVDLDPWIIHWQAFEDERARRGELRAAMSSLGPAVVGEEVVFRHTGSRPGRQRPGLRCTWAVSDGTSLSGSDVRHVFAVPGIHAVTLTVDDGGSRATTTQHITITGDPAAGPVLSLYAPDLPSFRPRPPGSMDVYGRAVEQAPYDIPLVARATRPRPEPRVVELRNTGKGTLAPARSTVESGTRDRWLQATIDGSGNRQRLVIHADATGLPIGRYTARVQVECAGAVNGSQDFAVTLLVPSHPPMHWALDLNGPGERSNPEEVRVDDASGAAAFYATPWFWTGHRFAFWPGPRGYGGFALTNGGRASATDFARFTPELDEGRYEVSLHSQTPFPDDARFAVRVHHRRGDSTVWIEPAKSRMIGTYDFAEGSDGYVELLTKDSRGGVTADCVVFRYRGGRPSRPPPSGRWQREEQ